ncbi:ribosome biogenesis protein UTP30 [Blastomyces parvus]|uniref:Ribosome biogenesis protein UTP30 n=1 Tax=Blastomyces parvus TaxID=2060905 RepID=A0A2B7XAJ8_9EURO|nr:ribosome biogenesis protein UTP30 [Blastomyces parvus]
MAVTSGVLTIKPTSGTPYQLNNDQVTRASSALLRHIKAEEEKKAVESTKKDLLADNDDEDDTEDSDATPVWLVVTTKKHIVDKNRLKPGKIPVPHSLNTSPSLSVCLITADPQRAVKDVIADPQFPATLSSRITKVIGYTKLKTKYKSFESRRRLLSEHDVFLADDRIIMRLVETLGKIFYKSSKRPVPIRIAEVQKVGGKRVKKEDRKRPPTDEKYSAVASPAIVAKEIEKTLASVPVHLASAATTSVRVGSANFTPEKLVENVEAVVQGMTEKYVSKGWRNIKALHLKGANTMAMPIWLASELWVDEGDVREDEDPKAIEGSKKTGKKRKSTGEPEPAKSKKPKTAEKEEDDDAELIASRKAKLQAQKARALSDGDQVNGSTPAVTTAPEGAATSSKKKRKSISKS